MRRVWFLILVLSVGLNAGLLYNEYVREPHRRPFDRGMRREGAPSTMDPQRMIERRLDFMSRRLDLSDEQRAKLKETMTALMPRMVEVHGRLGAARRAALASLTQPEIDASGYRAAITELNGVQAQMDSLAAESFLREASILRPDQRTQYFNWFMHERRHGRRERPGPRESRSDR